MIAENKSIIRCLVDEVIQQGQLDRIPDLFSPDYVAHDPSNPTRRGGHEGARAFIGMLHTGLREIGYAVDQMIAEGDLVSYRFTLEGVHTGPFMGVPPTGRRISVGGVDIFRLKGGKIVESWVYADALGMLIQLGVIAPPGPPPGA